MESVWWCSALPSVVMGAPSQTRACWGAIWIPVFAFSSPSYRAMKLTKTVCGTAPSVSFALVEWVCVLSSRGLGLSWWSHTSTMGWQIILCINNTPFDISLFITRLSRMWKFGWVMHSHNMRFPPIVAPDSLIEYVSVSHQILIYIFCCQFLFGLIFNGFFF